MPNSLTRLNRTSLQNAEHEASIVPLELALRVSQTEKKGV